MRSFKARACLPENKVCSLEATVQAVSSQRGENETFLPGCFIWGGGSYLFAGAGRTAGPWHCHPLGVGLLSAIALPASCFPVRSEEWKKHNTKQQTECESPLTMATEQGQMLRAVLLPIRVLHCPSHQPLETALCSPKSRCRRAGEIWKRTWALSLFIFLPSVRDWHWFSSLVSACRYSFSLWAWEGTSTKDKEGWLWE